MRTQILSQSLQTSSAGLVFSRQPQKPIRVDRFIEKRYRIVPQYEDILDGILGFTRFGAKGPEEVVVSRSLSEEGSRVAERRMNSTLAHEAGHMLLHGQSIRPGAPCRNALAVRGRP